MREKRSVLQTIAELCNRLGEGASEAEIRDQLDVENDLFPEYVKFALENNWITIHDGKYTVSRYGKEVIPELQSSS